MKSDEIKKDPSLFDYIDDLSSKKTYLYDETRLKNYNVFMINRGFAQHVDTVMLASEMNKRPALSQIMHHDFYFYGVDKKKRYGKWAKSDVSEEQAKLLAFIKTKYNVNNEVALLYFKLYDASELEEEYRKSLEFGGKSK